MINKEEKWTNAKTSQCNSLLTQPVLQYLQQQERDGGVAEAQWVKFPFLILNFLSDLYYIHRVCLLL